jgi:hypothetical protein
VANALLALRAADRLDVPASGLPRPRAYFGEGPFGSIPASRAPVVAGMLMLVAAMSARVIVTHRRRGRDAT